MINKFSVFECLEVDPFKNYVTFFYKIQPNNGAVRVIIVNAI